MSILLSLLVAVAADDQPLAKAVQVFAAAGNYQFTVADGGPMATPVEGKYQKGEPLYVKADKIEFFRKGDVMVYSKDGAWQRTRTGTLSDPLIILGASAKVRAVVPPHEEVSALVKVMRNLTKGDAKGQTVYTAELTEAAAKELARPSDRDLARSGRVDIWLDGEGNLTKYQLLIVVKGRRGNAEVDGTVTKTATLSEVGKTKVELPAAAKKALE